MQQSQTAEEIKSKGFTILIEEPRIAVALSFMWLIGILLTLIIFSSDSEFSKDAKKHRGFWFTLSVGFIFCAIVMVSYHLITTGRMLVEISEMADVALPSTFILAIITSILLIWRVLK